MASFHIKVGFESLFTVSLIECFAFRRVRSDIVDVNVVRFMRIHCTFLVRPLDRQSPPAFVVRHASYVLRCYCSIRIVISSPTSRSMQRRRQDGRISFCLGCTLSFSPTHSFVSIFLFRPSSFVIAALRLLDSCHSFTVHVRTFGGTLAPFACHSLLHIDVPVDHI
jgi:hypothetical protein